MKIAIGSDHGGYELKQQLLAHLEELGHEVRDFGSFSPEKVDYPDIAAPLARAVAAGEYERGLLICGTGLGMSIAANKIHGVRAACCSDCYSAKLTREHNDANILCMGGRVLGIGLAKMMVDFFLSTPFAGKHHEARIAKITELEQ